MTRMLSPAEVAQAVGLSRSAVYRAIDAGELAASKLRGRLRVDEVELEAWKRRTRVAARQAPAYEPPMPARPGKSGDVFTAEVRAITADAA